MTDHAYATTGSAAGRKLGAGALAAIIAGGVIALALVFGGGMATAWAIGPLGGGPGTSFTGESGPGQPPQFGNGGPQEDQGYPGQRREDSETESDSSTGTGTGT